MSAPWAGKAPTPDQWREILEDHARWLRLEDGGSRADLSGAVLTGVVLSGAVLTDADLTDAVLSGAVLRGVVLRGADLTRADLTGADLTGADLTDAVLSGADLTGADLTDAVLSGAVLTDADLTDVVLRGADLTRADLRGADLTRADLTGADLIRDDIWAVLSSAPAEVAGLRAALLEGRVDGSTYQGECACLVGTLANLRGCDYQSIAGLTPNASRPAERFFLLIQRGDTPATNPACKTALEWVDDWLGRMRAAFGSPSNGGAA